MPREKPPAGALSDFLNPQSMMTPGALGAITMLATNAFCNSFPGVIDPTWERAILGFALSFLFGLSATIKVGPWAQRALFYVLNSVIIFSVATGTNSAGSGLARAASLSLSSSAFASDDATRPTQTAQFFKPWFQAPVQEQAPSAAPAVPQGSVPRPPPAKTTSDANWFVTVGAYPTKDEAEKAALEINRAHGTKYHASVVGPPGWKSYNVVLGTNLSLDQAASLKDSADRDNLAPQTYLGRLSRR
jgi:hypothetical protein